MSFIKNIRHIQLNRISYTPRLYKVIIDYTPHPTEFDESDDIEYQKKLINILVKEEWFYSVSTAPSGANRMPVGPHCAHYFNNQK